VRAFCVPLGVLLGECQQCTGDGTALGQRVHDAPDLALAAEAILTEELYVFVCVRVCVCVCVHVCACMDL
jgi:hypothetical protein